MSTAIFYLQDSRSVVGNDMLFWKAGGSYTTDLSKARLFTRVEALAQHHVRETDIPWPKAYIDGKARPAVDVQYCKRSEALAGTGIVLLKRAWRSRPAERCAHCGVFLSAVQRYTEPCPKCGGDNAP